MWNVRFPDEEKAEGRAWPQTRRLQEHPRLRGGEDSGREHGGKEGGASGRVGKAPQLHARARLSLCQLHLLMGNRELTMAPTSQGRREHQLKRGA